MNNLFKSISTRKPKRNAFDLSHEKKLSMKFGYLTPTYLQEILPGDSFRITQETVFRFAPMVAPVMHRINAYTHFFFVPNRIIWDNWQTFITGGKDGTSEPYFPRTVYDNVNKPYFRKGSLSDYFGLPICPEAVTIADQQSFNILPFRAYQQIYNDYYRDQTISPEIVFSKGDTLVGGEEAALFTMRKRLWEKDYFTAALPWTQRGGEVELPTDINYKDKSIFRQEFTGEPIGSDTLITDTVGGLKGELTTNSGYIDNIESLGTTINDLRQAVRLQEWLEKNARAGSRYIEQILAHFGVRTPDYRLQRSEYLGGGKTPIQISEVLATFNSDTTAGGQMYGHGLGLGKNAGFKHSFNEHGYIIGITSVMPKPAYMNQGIPRMFAKFSKFDFAFPEFAHLGEQAIQNKELYFDFADISGVNGTVFGYVPRYSEYKFNFNSVHGDFNGELDYWHLGRKFATRPMLNQSFLECTPEECERIFAVDDSGASDKIYLQLYNDVKALRPLPVFGTPML